MKPSRLLFALPALAPGAALAATEPPKNGLPQMDFADPLTFIQLGWMALIMIVLYILLSRWALPRIGAVIAARARRIETDLEAAHRAKAEAEGAIEALHRSIHEARESAHATIARAVDAAKAEARARAEALNERLDAQLASSEAQIGEARAKAMESLRPVAEDLTSDLVRRLAGIAPEAAAVRHVLSSLGGHAPGPDQPLAATLEIAQ